MNRLDSYNTKQKDLILDIIKNNERPFTVKDIYNDLGSNVGLTTIYRFVDKLVEENRLNKYINKDNITYYEYLKECNKENHFYLKCDNCEKLVHVDCDCINELFGHIFKEHNFKATKERVIINGTCNKCIKKENNNE